MSFMLVIFLLLIVNTVSASEDNITVDKNNVQTDNSLSFDSNEIILDENFVSNDEISKKELVSTKKSVEINQSDDTRNDTSITVNYPDSIAYNENVIINGSFIDKTSNGVLYNSTIQVNLNGNALKVKTNANGEYTLVTRANNVGLNNVTLSHPGNKYFNPTNTSISYQVYKQDTIISINPINTSAYNENIKITGNFSDKAGNKLYNSMIYVTLNDKSFRVKTDENGTYIITTKASKLGTNNITLSHPGNENFNPTSTTSTYQIIKQDMKFDLKSVKVVDGYENVTVIGVLTDKSNNPMKNTHINLSVNNNEKVIKTDAEGNVNCEITSDVLEMNNITVTFSGNTYFNKYSFNKTLENPDVRLGDSEIHPGVEKTFLALVPYDGEGNGMFKINKKNISGVLNLEYGMVIYSYEIPSSYQSETYLLEFVYSGDNKYLGRTVNATLTLTPEGGRVYPTMSMNNFTLTYLKQTQLSVNIDDDAFGVITFRADEYNITSIKFKNGTITYNYTTKLTPGTYKLTAIYSGNFKYNPRTINSTLTVNKINSTVLMKNFSSKAGNKTLFTAKVTNELKQEIKNMNVTFKLNGNVIGSAITDKTGTANLYYTLPSSLYNKTYNITANAIESETTYGSSTQVTLTLNQLKTKVNVPSISTKPSKTIVITATVTDEFNNYVSKGVVTFKKDGVVLGKVNVSNGFAKFTYTTNYQTSNKTLVYASYVGDWKYASSNGKGSYEVTQLKTITTPSAIDAKPNSDIVLKAIIRDQNQNYASDGSVKFSINNSVIGTAKVINGVATLSYTLKEYVAGNYRIKAEYLGSKIYKASSNTNTMIVTRYGTSIHGNEINAIVGSNSTISVTVTDEEKYNVNSGQVKFYLNQEYLGSANVVNGISTLTTNIPAKYDGKTIKYYANYVKNGIYDSSSYTSTMTVTHQKTVYVSPSGSDSNLGDEKHPFKTIEYAINHISLFGTVKLAAGTYYVSGLHLNTSVNLIGSGKDKCIIDGKKSGVPVFNITKRNAVLTIKDITIQNGKSNKDFSAGAIVTSGKLNIANSKFMNNTGSGLFSGGAIYTNGILNITNTEFINNVVTNVNSQGGAIRCYDNTTYITKCKFESNQVTGTNSTGASAIYGDSSDIIINNTKFNNNIAKGKYITGGVIRAINGAVVIDSSKFTNNKVTATDYAMGGIIGSLSSGISIINTTLASTTVKATNSAGGSALYGEVAAIDIKDSYITSNTASAKNVYGGAIYTYKVQLTLINNRVDSNKITDTNNAYGGAVYAYQGQVDINQTSFRSNSIKAKTLALAGAIYSYSTVKIVKSTFEKNNINASNLGGGAIANMGTLTVSYTNFINNNAYNAGNAITATNSSKNSIEHNYWGSSSPNWTNLLYSVSKPKTYSKSKL